MKHIIRLATALFFLTAITAHASDFSILFIGNSYTNAHDLPNLFRNLSNAAGINVEVDQSTLGGATLEQHLSNQATLDKISEKPWDMIILQEQSLYPVIEYYRLNRFEPAARALDTIIAEAGARTAFFMTWGREFGGQHCISTHCSAHYPDYFSMQTDLSTAYSSISEELNALLVPVGDLWASALTSDPDSPLWGPDNAHPSPEGSYLAACVLFAKIFDLSPEGLFYFGSISPDRAYFYQNIAAQIVPVSAAPSENQNPRPIVLSNYPNPFNPTTWLQFELKEESAVVIEVFDASGELVSTVDGGTLAAGKHQIPWNADQLASGVYFCRFKARSEVGMHKMMLLK